LKGGPITEAKRNPHWPNTPAVAESYPGYEVSFFVGISAPRGAAADVVAKIHGAIQDAASDPKVKEPLEKAGLTFVRQPLGGYRAFIVTQRERWREHVKAAGIERQ
jgi:tripartite-type tricarboxylate transporter receptor subunit TctC